MEKDETYKIHILEAIKRMESYLSGISQEQFLDNNLMQAAVSRELSIIGEAVKRLTNQFKSSFTGIPWKNIAGTRDIIIHDYTRVKPEILWTTITEDIPKLKSALEK